MAFLVKNSNVPRTAGPAGNGQAVLSEWIHVARPAATLPQTTTAQLFNVRGGRVLVHALLGEATVVLTSTDPQLSINSSKLNTALTAIVGTTIVVATTVSLASLEVGGLVVVEGDGTAIIKAVAGGALTTTVLNHAWIAPNGEIYITTADNNTTGQIKWDLWYQPLDEGAYVTANTGLSGVGAVAI